MLGDIAKLFSKEFLVGFVLPAGGFLAAAIPIYGQFSPLPLESLQSPSGFLQSAQTIAALFLLSWIMGLMLLALNRPLTRLLEGYHLLGRTPLIYLQRFKFDRLQTELEKTKERFRQEKKETGAVTKVTRRKYDRLLLHWRRSFPVQRDHVLATGFGNTLRAFEVYSQEMYGLDSIAVWARLLGVIPSEYRQILNERGARIDFALNSFYLTILVGIEYAVLVFRTNNFSPIPLAIPLLLLTAFFFYQMAISSAMQYGNAFKASIDLYRLDLLDKMNFQPPKNLEQEKGMWLKISQSFLYWTPLELPRKLKEEPSKDEDSVTNQRMVGLLLGQSKRDKDRKNP